VNVIKGRTFPPDRTVIYGPPGVGKSTFACSGPGVLALDYEYGLEHIGPDRVRGAESWPKTLELVREACLSEGGHTKVVVDTLDRLEDQATMAVCADGKKKALSDFGYGDGFEALLTKWRELLLILEVAREKGREVILVCHVQQKTQDDPTIGSYSKYIAALSKRCWGATHRWADNVLFANYECGLVEGRAVMTGQRLAYTQAGTGYDAKNRWNLPHSIPLRWDAFDTARRSSSRPADSIRASIRSLTTTDTAEKAEAYIAEAGEDITKLIKIENALKGKRT